MNSTLSDLSTFEKIAIWPCAAVALLMGVAPILWLGAIDPAVQAALTPFARVASRVVVSDLLYNDRRDTDRDFLSQATRGILPQSAEYVRILPEIVLSVFGMIVMLLEPLLDEATGQKVLGWIGLCGTLAGLGATWFMAQAPGLAVWNMVKVDGFSVFFHVLVIAIAAVVILTSCEYMAVQRIRAGEYYALILFGTVGMALMSSAVELVLIFIALEISSISSYVLAGFRRREASSAESSLKYFLLGSFATAFFLYGVALMFGATGSTNIDQIGQALRSGTIPLLAFVAVAFMFVGLRIQVRPLRLSTFGPRTFMKERRRRLLASCPPPRRRRRLQFYCASFL